MSTATEVGMRRRAAEPHMDALMACLRLMSDIPVTLFIAPSATCDLARAAKTAAPRKLRVGDRVWCRPGEPAGYEAVIVDAVHPDFGPSHMRVQQPNGVRAAPPANLVVAFDENHNQKREFAKGKKIQGRLKLLGVAGIWIDVDPPIWHEATEYRVKPAVASEKWGPERAAHARGERIEARALPGRYNPDTAHRWHYVDVPVWSAGCEYRVQPPLAQRDYRLDSHSAQMRAMVDSAALAPAMTIDCDFAAPASDPYAEVKAAAAAGKKIEVQFHSWDDWKIWTASDAPTFSSPAHCYRVADPYREVKAAIAAGKAVQFRFSKGGGWVDPWKPENLCFCFPPSEYRVKPVVEVKPLEFRTYGYEPLCVKVEVERTDGKVTNVTVKDFS